MSWFVVVCIAHVEGHIPSFMLRHYVLVRCVVSTLSVVTVWAVSEPWVVCFCWQSAITMALVYLTLERWLSWQRSGRPFHNRGTALCLLTSPNGNSRRHVFLFHFFLLLFCFLANVNSSSRSLYVVVRPSVCHLSVCRLSVTFVCPTQAIEIFSNISMPQGILAIYWHPCKILRRSSQGNPSIGGVKQKRGSRI